MSTRIDPCSRGLLGLVWVLQTVPVLPVVPVCPVEGARARARVPMDAHGVPVGAREARGACRDQSRVH